ncbi:MAG: PAS domain-containing protein [Leptolyngbyaceae cyanobacterium MAG.088]|nr:PAS domain-containing protein [Leptolyngbyaceae cyanobacterium MAG.088]
MKPQTSEQVQLNDLSQDIATANTKFSGLDYAPVGFCVLRQDFRVLFWNNCLAGWTQISSQEMVGTDLRQKFPNINQSKYLARLNQVFQSGFPAIFSPQLHQSVIPSTLSNGQMRIQQTTVTAVPAPGAQGFYALFAIQDVTDLTHRVQIYQAELRERKRTESELQRSNAELEQFAYVASHDLREPLRMVTSFTQLLAQRYTDQLDEEANTIINFAVDGASRMHSLIDDLLTFSRVGTQGNPFELTDCDDALTLALSNLQILLNEAQASITTAPLPTVLADPAQLVQLFQNLISNALKYRSERPLTIEIGADLQEKEWVIWIRDNGIGLKPKYADRIFLIFQRLHTRQEYSGTGIGLAICKKIVERHHGNIWVESELNKGAKFCFTLPRPDFKTVTNLIP